jgi:hypothetical protein
MINMLPLGEPEFATIQNTGNKSNADQDHQREGDKLGRPAVENDLQHLDGFDQIFGSSFAHQLPPPRVSAGRGSAETLSAKRGAVRFAVTAGIFSAAYELWSSRIFRSLTEYESE